jgi:hypothetical protein
MVNDSQPVIHDEASRQRLGSLLLGGFGAAAGAFVGATAGLFVTPHFFVRYIGPPLTWLLGVAVGGAVGLGVGLYLMLRLVRSGQS